MTEKELDYYEAGIMDANEQRRIVAPAKSQRFYVLATRDNFPIGKDAIMMLDAYNRGIAHEINRQLRLLGINE